MTSIKSQSSRGKWVKALKEKILTPDTALSLVVALLILFASAVSLFYNESLYTKHLTRVHDDPPEAIVLSHQLITYFKAPGYAPTTIEGFSGAEKSHLIDVKILMHAFTLLLPFLTLLSMFLWKRSKNKRVIQIGSALPLLFILLAIILPFDNLFTFFHQLFFPQGNWVFPLNSLLISTYPIEFFALMAQSLAIRILSLSLMLLALIQVKQGYHEQA